LSDARAWQRLPQFSSDGLKLIMRSPPGATSTCLAGPGRAACEIQKSAAQPTANSAEINLARILGMTQTGRAHHRGSGNLFGRRLKQAGKNRQSRAQILRPMSDNAILAAMRRMGRADRREAAC